LSITSECPGSAAACAAISAARVAPRLARKADESRSAPRRFPAFIGFWRAEMTIKADKSRGKPI